MTDLETITDATGYSEMFDACADLVEASPDPGIAAGALLNAAIAIFLSTAGPDVTASALRHAADAVPAEVAKAKRRLA